jgi:Arc/MetJ-type ribon-helix-helix transcriptional regulator
MSKKHVVKVFRVKMSEHMSHGIDSLVEDGIYMSYADALRHAFDML